MSKILAIDTSTSRTSVAILDGETVLFSGCLDGATAHAATSTRGIANGCREGRSGCDAVA